MKEKRIVTCTYSRGVTFGDFIINPGEEKVLPEGLEIPEEWKNHVHIVRVEKEKLKVEKEEKKGKKTRKISITENPIYGESTEVE